MKPLFAFLVLAALCAGQTVTPTISSTTVSPGGSVVMHINYATSTPDTAGLQWNLSVPAGVQMAETIGAAGTIAAKTLSCNSSGSTCLVVGINQNKVGAGEVATYTATFPTSMAPGTYTFTLSATQGVTPAGLPLSVDAGAAVNVVLACGSSVTDLNGDCITNSIDVQITVNQALTSRLGSCSTNGDINHDGKCDLTDIQLVIYAALGL